MENTIILPIMGSDQVLEIDLDEFMKDEKAADAYKNGHKMWIENFKIDSKGNAVFDLKIYYPN